MAVGNASGWLTAQMLLLIAWLFSESGFARVSRLRTTGQQDLSRQPISGCALEFLFPRINPLSLLACSMCQLLRFPRLSLVEFSLEFIRPHSGRLLCLLLISTCRNRCGCPIVHNLPDFAPSPVRINDLLFWTRTLLDFLRQIPCPHVGASMCMCYLHAHTAVYKPAAYAHMHACVRHACISAYMLVRR